MSINIFEIIQNVSSRIEPFHSQFLSQALRFDKLLLDKFIKLVYQSLGVEEKYKLINVEKLIVKAEDSFSDNKRIDIIILDPINKTILAIEVKTSDTSVTKNQLISYYKNLSAKYNDHKIIMVYITPFNVYNLPEKISPVSIHAINEFSDFNKKINNSIHINWDDVTGMYETSISFHNCIYILHKEFISSKVTNKQHLIQKINSISRNRGLTEFFGKDCVELFFDSLIDNGIKYNEDVSKIIISIDDNVENLENLISTLDILINSKAFLHQERKDEISDDLILRYKSGINSKFFELFFNHLKIHPHLWLKGKDSIGVRASHARHKSSGVSLFTLSESQIQIFKSR